VRDGRDISNGCDDEAADAGRDGAFADAARSLHKDSTGAGHVSMASCSPSAAV